MNNYVLEILAYRPKVYSGLDHYIVALAQQMQRQGITLVAVYTDTMEYQPDIANDITAAGGIVEVLKHSHTAKQIGEICRLYRKYKPIVVDTHFNKHIKLYTALLSKYYGIRHFTHLHSLIGDVCQYKQTGGSFKRIGWGCYYYLLNKLSTSVLCVSNSICRQYREWAYGKNSALQTLYIGTPVRQPLYNQAEVRRRFQLSDNRFIITNVSAIEPIKGIDVILQALAQLKMRYPDILFVHIGGLRSDTDAEQQYQESLCRLVEHLELQDNVIWLGRQQCVQDILPFADVYIHPSRSEGLGSALLEASMAKLPCVATRVGGIPEVVVDSQTGILVDSDSVEQLSRAIELLYLHPQLRTTYGNNAASYVLTTHNQSLQVMQQMSLYFSH